jgi:hypothetical protein
MQHINIRSLATVLIISFLFGSMVMASEVNFEGEKAIIKSVIEASIGWADNKDTTLLFNSVAQDEDLFYFSPDNASTISGFKMFQEFTRKTFMGDHFKALWVKTKEMAINLSRSGDVAWWHCLLDDMGLWYGKEGGWKDVRWTGTLEKRDGKWVIVQMHFSFATEQMADEKK